MGTKICVFVCLCVAIPLENRSGQENCTGSFGLVLGILLSVEEKIFTSQDAPTFQQFSILSFFDEESHFFFGLSHQSTAKCDTCSC
jgi:hypothetical protein